MKCMLSAAHRMRRVAVWAFGAVALGAVLTLSACKTMQTNDEMGRVEDGKMFGVDPCKTPFVTCVKVILPPLLVEAGGLKTVSVASAGGPGGPSLVTAFEARLSKVMVDDKPFYKLVRTNDPTRQATFEIGSTEWSVNEQRETQDRSQCVDKKCKQTTTAKVTCTVRKATVGVVMKLRDRSGAELATRTFGNTADSTQCQGEPGTLDAPAVVLGKASDKSLEVLQDALAVRVAMKPVRVMNDPSNIGDAERKQRFASAVEFARAGRMDRACPMFAELAEVETKSVAVFYNLGFCDQVGGDWGHAFQWYSKADANSTKPLDELKEALAETRPYVRKRGA